MLAARDATGARPCRAVATTPVGCYVHVPFCLRRCGYCAFNTYAVAGTDARPRYRSFLTGVGAELERAAEALAEAPPVATVYLGGGTPTLLGADGIGEVLDLVRRHLQLAHDVEVSVEANPDTVDPGLLAGLVQAGCDRLSLGMQSADPHVLALLDRAHGPERAVAAVAEAREAGFRSVSLDLIAGTPGESAASWARSLDTAVAAAPDHLSVYSLGIEPGTRLAARVRRGLLPAPDDAEQAARYRWTEDRLGRAGYRWYEVSNWATGDDHRCRHNLGYWRNHHWWGVGPGAHSHLAGRRWWNERDPDRWAALLAGGADPAVGREAVSPEEARTEDLLLGVRLAEGFPADRVAPAALADLEAEGLVSVSSDGRVVLTVDGRLLADRVVLALL